MNHNSSRCEAVVLICTENSLPVVGVSVYKVDELMDGERVSEKFECLPWAGEPVSVRSTLIGLCNCKQINLSISPNELSRFHTAIG